MNGKQWFSALVALVVVAVFVWYVLDREELSDETRGADLGSGAELDEPARALSIVLSKRKLESAKIQFEPVKRSDLQVSRMLPGRFAYDEARHVAIRVPTDGVLTEVVVQVGDAISEGQPVAVLQSPTIGEVRSRILAAQSEVELAEKSYRWENATREGAERVAEAIQSGRSMEEVEKVIEGKFAGELGGKLVAAYSQSNHADNVLQSINHVENSGAVSGYLVRQRQNDQRQATANLKAIVDQARIETELTTAKAEARVNAARRSLLIAKQTLASLLGAGLSSQSDLDLSPNEQDVSRLVIKSPISGTVEWRGYSKTERLSAQDELFVIADTSVLWVEADIRSRDWGAIHIKAGGNVQVNVPSVDCPTQDAEVVFVGRQVDPVSGAIPLVARVSNEANQFRPGLFARVSVPAFQLNEVLTVPESAIVDIDGHDTVFLHRSGRFYPADVEIGKRGSGRVEILSGIDASEEVVTKGAFVLKSELLLEGEE